MRQGDGVRLAIDVRCQLGEGPIWHPERGSLIWCDIGLNVLYEARPPGGPLVAIGFGEAVSATGLIDETSVAVATASGLWRVDLEREERFLIAPLEADDPATRSNDGRIGPGGAFWVGTMGYALEAGAGTLYRFADGAFSRVLENVTAPNSLAFAPDGSRAYFADSADRRILVIPLDPKTGAPMGAPDVFIDLSGEESVPDGAVTDTEGALWCAEWGASRVTRFLPDGRRDRVINFPVSLVTCPAFGGPDLKTLFVTSARYKMSAADLAREPLSGAVFAIDVDAPGCPERKLTL